MAGNIAMARVLTIPAAALMGGAVYELTHAFGAGATGPLVVSLICVGALVLLLLRRIQRGPRIPAAEGAE